jgi:sugar/nucleoside kinase (ribokinase family)
MGRILCLGEALVDLVCERPAAGLAEADAFVPHFGGAVANVAVFAARAGAAVAVAGGVGDDEWGRWLRARLEREGVDVEWLGFDEDGQTAVAVVAVDASGEAHYEIYGERLSRLVPVLSAERLAEAVEGSAALYFSSNTLVDDDERELTMGARELALSLERPVIFDPNLRLSRWRSHADATASANACVPGALLVRANAFEAEAMTGESDPERAALAMLKAGARMVVITLGARGALLRGELRADAPGVPVEVRSTIGAGDAFTGVLLARIALAGFYPAAAAAALRDAVAAGAAACERWGALD